MAVVSRDSRRRLVAKARAQFHTRILAAHGSGTVIYPPSTLVGPRRISLGAHVMIGPGSWLGAIDDGWLEIGDAVRCTGNVTISAAGHIVIEDHVLMARNVHVYDHEHVRTDPSVPISLQGLTPPRPVRIRSGAWLGANAVILQGVTIGRNAVIGANAVVKHDVPNHAVAVGAPARLVERRRP